MNLNSLKIEEERKYISKKLSQYISPYDTMICKEKVIGHEI